jgi:hypothetical protein
MTHFTFKPNHSSLIENPLTSAMVAALAAHSGATCSAHHIAQMRWLLTFSAVGINITTGTVPMGVVGSVSTAVTD